MKTKIEYRDGMHFEGLTPSGHSIQWDSGPADTETQGPTPMEAFLQATAACGAMDVVSILKKRRKEISSFELEIEGVRSESYPKVFTHMTITYRIGGENITLEEVGKAMKLSQDKYCSITNMLKPTVNVNYSVELV